MTPIPASLDVLLLNGPNLNLLGLREPLIYGSETLEDVEADCARLAHELGLSIDCRQSNHEGQLLDWLHEARGSTRAVILNAGAYTHTSIALHDALAAFPGLVFEVHISNVHAREPFRNHSYVSPQADGIIVGCGTDGYRLALRRIAALLSAAPRPSPG